MFSSFEAAPAPVPDGGGFGGGGGMAGGIGESFVVVKI